MKLYIVIDKALRAGAKIAQACHAMRQFVAEHPEVDNLWHTTSNNLVVLENLDLTVLASELEAAGFKLSRFHEPDFGGRLTAICVEPDAWRRLSHLPLASGGRHERQAA
jgi:hypothetical protein